MDDGTDAIDNEAHEQAELVKAVGEADFQVGRLHPRQNAEHHRLAGVVQELLQHDDERHGHG
ncbi:MAG: hypothetical protein DDT34_02490 [Firmicutes bacterium]|nr:hypothetical protein [Bacillota bacterium]